MPVPVPVPVPVRHAGAGRTGRLLGAFAVLGALSLVAVEGASAAGDGTSSPVAGEGEGEGYGAGPVVVDHGLRTYGCHGRGVLQRPPFRARPGRIGLRNVATGLCLDDSGRPGLRTYGCDAPWQTWWFTRVG